MNAIWKPSHFVGAYVYEDASAQYVFGDEGEPVYEPFGGSRPDRIDMLTTQDGVGRSRADYRSIGVKLVTGHLFGVEKWVSGR